MVLTQTSFSLQFGIMSNKSTLFQTKIYGKFLSWNNANNALSSTDKPIQTSTTNTAISVCFKISCVFCMRNVPNSPSSSSPGVSMMSTGPNGNNSIAFLTGSVVVPLTSDTTAMFCPVIAFTKLDFPALRMPKKPICIRSELVVFCKLITNLLI